MFKASPYPFERRIVQEIRSGLAGRKKLLQIITGPRQVGKTTAALQVAANWQGPVVHASADEPLPPGPEWIFSQWQSAEIALGKDQVSERGALLILDEVQKVKGWSEAVKGVWDAAIREGKKIEVILLGSSSLLIPKGITESLAGRFLLYRCSHWGLEEVTKAFSWNLDQWLFFGGYPGAAELIESEPKWRSYVADSLIETVLAKDVLQLQTVAKPALLRHLFLLACTYPALILSYTKMLGQLHDAGNTTTLAHYLQLLESAYLVTGLELFKRGRQAKRGSSPKFVIWNNGLINAVTQSLFSRIHDDLSWRGRLLENAVGAHLLNNMGGLTYSIYYWRHKSYEVDFVIETPGKLWALEVKSGKPGNTNGLKKFCELYPETRPLIIGRSGIDFEDFFRSDPKEIFI